MSRDITGALGRWLAEGFSEIGQVAIRGTASGGFELRHIEDADRLGLDEYRNPGEARQLATFDGRGAFRPLRTAPNLRKGWRLQVDNLAALRTALDHFYPGMLGVFLSHHLGQLPVIPLRALLDRQTGMYAVTKKVTDDQAQRTVGAFCRSDGGCLKTILWQISPELPVASLPQRKFDPVRNQTGGNRRAIPMLCHEGCNLLVAEVRTVVKYEKLV